MTYDDDDDLPVHDLNEQNGERLDHQSAAVMKMRDFDQQNLWFL